MLWGTEAVPSKRLPLPNGPFWTDKKFLSRRQLPPAKWVPKISKMDWQIPCCWRTRRPGRLRFPVLNNAFWNVKKKAKTTVGMRKHSFKTPNPQAAEGCQCLTLLSGPSRRKPKTAVWMEKHRLTPNPHAAGGRGGPGGWGCQCLALLSGSFWNVKKKAKSTVGMEKQASKR